MKIPPAIVFVFAAGLLAGRPAIGAESTSPPPAPPAKSNDKTAPAKKAAPAGSPAASPSPSSAPAAPDSDGVQRLVREFGEKRTDILDERKILLERLRGAKTDEEKQRVIAEIRQLQQQRIEEQREQARQIREQMQNNRETRRGS